MRRTLLLCVAFVLLPNCRSFQPSPNVNPLGRRESIQRFAAPKVTGSESFDLSSGFISQLAVAAIRARLRDHTSVKCEVSAQNNGLLVGSFFVGPATVKGRGWQSGMGLTCRAIEAKVDMCELDKTQVVTERRLVLKQASFGDAMVALDKNDFGNFLAHPMLKPPSLRKNTVQFLQDGAAINHDSKTVSFHICYNRKRQRGEEAESEGETESKNAARWTCTLRRTANAEKRAVIEVSPVEPIDEEDGVDTLAAELGSMLTNYFNELIFELDGTFLTFRDLMISNKGASPSVLLKMGIKVEKFPSRNLAF